MAESLDGLRIKCDDCELPICKVVGNTLVIQSRHHGEVHRTVVQIGKLVQLANEQIARERERLSEAVQT